MHMVEQEASGHDFSRAVKGAKMNWALAPEGRFCISSAANQNQQIVFSQVYRPHDFDL
jgi:hypothetical protein